MSSILCGFEDSAHIFGCVYKILTTFYIKEESSTTTKSLPDEDKTKGVHIFAFVYKLLTTFHIKKESSTATKSFPDEVKTKGIHIFAFVYKKPTTFHIKKESSTAIKSLPDEDKNKESASDREQLPHATSFENYPTVLDIRKTLPIDLEQRGHRELQIPTIPEGETFFSVRDFMSAVQNEPRDDVDRMMNSEKGPDLDEISPQIVTIEDEPGENEPDQNLACVPMTLTIKKGSEPGEDEPYQNLACVPASLTIKKGFEPGENEPDQNLARVPATLNIKKVSETVTIENEPGWDLMQSDTIENGLICLNILSQSRSNFLLPKTGQRSTKTWVNHYDLQPI